MTAAIKPATRTSQKHQLISTDQLRRVVRVEIVMMSIEMDLPSADSNDYIHADRSLQFKRERRKVGKHLLHSIDNKNTNFALQFYKDVLYQSYDVVVWTSSYYNL